MGSDLIAVEDISDTQKWGFALYWFALDAGRDDVAARVRDAAVRVVAVAEADVVGYAVIERGAGPASHAGTLRVSVAEGLRSGGIGTLLLETALEAADKQGITRIVATPYLPADASGFRKVAFFNRHGFTLEGIARRFARLEDGTFVDAALMARVR